MWKEFLINLNSNYVDKLNPPASMEKLIEVEKELNIQFPRGLKNFLCESNGLKDDCTMWSVERIREENLSLRNSDIIKEYYMPIDCFLFFGDAGNGDYFGYSIVNGEILRSDIYVWDHEEDSRRVISPSLKIYLKDSLSGDLIIWIIYYMLKSEPYFLH